MKNNEAREEQKFVVDYRKEAKPGDDKILQLIDTHLRYLMLFEAFEKIASEVAMFSDSKLTVDRSNYSAKSRVNIGSVLEVDIGLQFFAADPSLLKKEGEEGLAQDPNE